MGDEVHSGGIQVKNSQIASQIDPRNHPVRFIGIAIFRLISIYTAFVNWVLPKFFVTTLNNTTNAVIQKKM